MHKTKYNSFMPYFIILELIPMYTLVSKIHVIISRIVFIKFRVVSTASNYKSRGCVFESHCGQDCSFCILSLRRAPGRSIGPTNEMKHEVIRDK